MKELTEDEFYDIIELEPNHIVSNAPFDGKMFETFEKELDYVKSMIKDKRVITILEVDGNLYYFSGFHFVNRLGYFITKEPIKFEFKVKVD